LSNSEGQGTVFGAICTPPVLSIECPIWRAALHELGTGEGFGPCRRDGTCAEAWPGDARDYTAAKLRGQIERAVQGRYIHDDERATLEAACGLIAAFAGERPVPCHRDY